MKKLNKIAIFIILVLSIFAIKEDVHADSCAHFNYKTIIIKAYIADDENSEFKEYEMPRSYVDNGIISTLDQNGNSTRIIPGNVQIYSENDIYESNLVEVIADKYMLTIPQKEGYNFDGWYLDKEFKNKVDDSDFENSKPLAELELVLYGKWTQESIHKSSNIYELGKDDIYIVTLMEGQYLSCDIYGQYIYIPKNGYMSNDKGKYNELPVLSDLDDKKFDGWYVAGENIRISSVNDLIDKTDNYHGIIDYLYPAYRNSTIDQTDDIEIFDTTDTKEKVTDTKNDNTILYICIGSGIGIAIVAILTSIVGVRKQKKEPNND